MSQADIAKNILNELSDRGLLSEGLISDFRDIKICKSNDIQTKYPVLIRDGEMEEDSRGRRRYYESYKYNVKFNGNTFLLTNDWYPKKIGSLVSFLELEHTIRLNTDIPNTTNNQNNGSSVERKSRMNWPNWSCPNEEELKEATKVLIPYLKFLNPSVIESLAKDNNKKIDWFNDYLSSNGINTTTYIWDGCVTAFPGIRRANGKTDNKYKKKQLPIDLRSDKQAIYIDDNSYAKHIWAFIYTNGQFSNIGPDEYELAHIFEHKQSARSLSEFSTMEIELDSMPMSGLFTSPVGTVYTPRSFVKITDHSNYARNLLQRKVIDLYRDYCNVLPPGLEITKLENEWDLDEFDWPSTQKETNNIDEFLKYRKKRIEEILSLKIPRK